MKPERGILNVNEEEFMGQVMKYLTKKLTENTFYDT
jgi:hypothetical protein